MPTRLARLLAALIAACAAATAARAEAPLVSPWDTLSLRVFEWRAGSGETFAWEPFDGEFRVGADGRLALPLIGSIEAAGRTTEDIGIEVGRRLQETVGLRDTPSAVVEIAEFRPFYVVGAVDKPGEYPFRPGLTVLQAVSIAGGMRRGPEMFDRLERDAITARGQMRVYALQIDQLAARRARLQSELDGLETIAFPEELLERRDDPSIARLLREEELIFAARAKSLADEIAANEKLQVLLQDQIESLEASIELKAQQVASVEAELRNVRSLVERGLGTAPRLGELERRLTDYESDQRDLTRSIIRAQVDINQAERNVIALSTTFRREVAAELRNAQSELEELVERFDATARLVDEAEVIAPRRAESERAREAVEPIYSVIRAEDGRMREIPATELTELRPGDTVRVLRPSPALPAIGEARRGAPASASLARSERTQ